MATFKIWGSGNIVKQQETYDGTTEYNHIENLFMDDSVHYKDLSRPIRNIYQNQENMYDFLDSLTKTKLKEKGIFKRDLSFNINTANDIVNVSAGGEFEEFEFTVSYTTIGELSGKYFTFHSVSIDYYLWFNLDGSDSDPGDSVGTLTGFEGIQIPVDTTITNTPTLVAELIGQVVAQQADFYTTVVGETITIKNAIYGPVTLAGFIENTSGWTLTQTEIGKYNYKTYARLPGGIAYNNDNIVVVKPNTYVVERQLENLFKLRTTEAIPEKVEILYFPNTDKFQAKILKRNFQNVMQTYEFTNGGTYGNEADGYNTGVQLIVAIFETPLFHFVLKSKIDFDYEKLPLEPTYHLADTAISTTVDIFIDENGEVLFDNDYTPDANHLRICSFDYTADDDTFNVSNFVDRREFQQNYNTFSDGIYLNVPRTWNNDDVLNITDILDHNNASVDWSQVNNESKILTVLREHDGTPASASATIAWVEGQLSDFGNTGVDPSVGSDKFYINKDLVIRYNTGANDYEVMSHFIASAVRIYGNQSIAGIKDFINEIRFEDAITFTLNQNAVINVGTTTTLRYLQLYNSTASAGLKVGSLLVSDDYGYADPTRNNAVIKGNLTIGGNLTVEGASTTINVETVTIEDNILLLNSGLVGAPPIGLESGIEVNRGSSTNYQFIFREDGLTFRAGQVGSTQALATRQDAPTANGVPFWNSGQNRFDTLNMVSNGSVLTVGTSTIDTDSVIRAHGNRFTLGGNSTTVKSFWFRPSGTGSSVILDSTSGTSENAFRILTGTSTPTTTRLRMHSDGRFQIGAPTSFIAGVQLHVIGEVRASSFQITSSRAFKSNIVDTNLDAIDLIKSLKVKEYTLNSLPDRKRLGIIAEDTNEIISGKNKDSFDIYQANSVLILAVQELIRRVECLSKTQMV